MVKSGIVGFILLMTIAVTSYALDMASLENDYSQRVLRPAVTEKYQYYEIRGASEKELRKQMNQNGTKWDDGKTYDALTTWNVKWDYDYNCKDHGCTVESFKPIVEIIFRYPKWVRTEQDPRQLVKKWDHYMGNLIIHENLHRDMVLEAVAEFSRAVAQLPGSSRAALDQKIRDLISRRMAQLNDDQKEYDAATIHGTTQGAVFP